MMKNALNYLYLLIITLMLASCQKDSNTLVNTEVEFESQSFEETNFNGLVVDGNGAAIEGATVMIGNIVDHTDHNGFFTFRTTALQKGAALRVTKDGYFSGLGNLSLNTGQDNFLKIAMQARDLVATINSTDGGAVEFGEHKVTLASNSFTLVSGDLYNGEVEVYMTYIDPTADNFSEIMPGDLLVGNDLNPGAEVLRSFGMLHVELSTPQGEELQIIQAATLEMTIPSTILMDAPDNIPLWFFDESKGLWIEEGEATKVGTKYIGTVNHFTLWNCDVPFDAVTLKGTFHSRSTLKNLEVKVTSESTGDWRKTWTNSLGIFTGKVPANDTYLIQVFNECGGLVFSQTVEVLDEDLCIDFFIDIADVDLITLNGYVTDCNGELLPRAYLLIKRGADSETLIMQSDNNGYIEVDFYRCNDGDISITVVDLNTATQSTATYQLVDNQINIGNLEACGDQVVSKIVYEINGELETIYLVNVEVVLGNPNGYIFRNPRSFPDGSSFLTEYQLGYNLSGVAQWEIFTQFKDVVGSPPNAYALELDNNFDILDETDEYVEIEFPIVRIFDDVANVLLDEEGKVYIKAAK